ncbi:hypothetical protein VFPPC_03990 [Pochonia chlamydosporia 170]|uniref:C2H2-type domain-containing protein n=1 Tax=Pochonia chlamydosporia 170 TaxID=1380566 RepID=A0A179FR51_METCM|nr:hypothetical protein VFPPC_03990 [Pochonia chlamydosporia 170]OAQ67621.2 hypothetical protein VFPPC_03990 [Pochonia chlamydosporia 170]
MAVIDEYNPQLAQMPIESGATRHCKNQLHLFQPDNEILRLASEPFACEHSDLYCDVLGDLIDPRAVFSEKAKHLILHDWLEQPEARLREEASSLLSLLHELMLGLKRLRRSHSSRFTPESLLSQYFEILDSIAGDISDKPECCSPNTSLTPIGPTSLDILSLGNSIVRSTGSFQNLAEGIDFLHWLKLASLLISWFIKRCRKYHYLLLSCTYILIHFLEFPKGIPHLCTTMPWTIWPSLIVLWGVCWMFYWPEENNIDIYFNFEEEFPPTSMQDDMSNELLDMSTPNINDWLLPTDNTPLINNGQETHSTLHPSTLHYNSIPHEAEITSNFQPAPTTYTHQNAPGNTETPTPAPPSPTKPPSLECPHCNKTYSRTDALRRHQREQHSNNKGSGDDETKKFPCPHRECRKSFKRYERLQRHLKTCKAQKRIDGLNASVPPKIDGRTITMRSETVDNESEVSTAEDQVLSQTTPSSEKLHDESTLLMELQKRHRLERAKLDKMEKNVRESKDLIASIEFVMNSLQGGGK